MASCRTEAEVRAMYLDSFCGFLRPDCTPRFRRLAEFLGCSHGDSTFNDRQWQYLYWLTHHYLRKSVRGIPLITPALIDTDYYQECCQNTARRFPEFAPHFFEVTDGVLHGILLPGEEPVLEIASTPVVKDAVEGLFDRLEFGENASAFKLLEHITNQMRTEGSTMRLGLFGPASAGKTTAAGIVAEGVGRPFFAASSDWYNRFRAHEGFVRAVSGGLEGTFPDAIRKAMTTYHNGLVNMKPCVVFIDEAHKLNDSTQNALLTITEAPFKARHEGVEIDFSQVCFILATTDSSQLVKPLRTRVTHVTFQNYGIESLTNMVRRKFPRIPQETAVRVVYAGKLIPRSALQIASLLRPGREEHDLQSMFNIDKDGLDGRDRQIIEVLNTHLVHIDPLKLAQAEQLLRMYEEGNRVSANQVAAARALLDAPKRFKPIGITGLADKLGLTDLEELRERVNALEVRGFLHRTPRGVIPSEVHNDQKERAGSTPYGTK